MTHIDHKIISSSRKATPDLQEAIETVSASQPRVILPSQLKAARALLGWTRSQCGKAANLSPETIKNIEHEVFKPQESTHAKLINIFAVHGIEFISMVDFRLHTLSGNALDRIVNVTGAVLLAPTVEGEDKP